MDNVLVTRDSDGPPPTPTTINGILFNKWLSMETGERKEWNGKEWVVTEKGAIE